MMNEHKGRDIFYGVVAIATLIVAIVGATLAYFSVTATSNEGAVNATAAIVSIEYNDGQQVTAQADELIPSTLSVVQQVYESKIKTLTAGEKIPKNQCLDKNGRQVCSVYRFTVKSDLERTITAWLKNEHNGFTYLSYAVYDIVNEDWLPLTSDGKVFDQPLKPCSNDNEDTEDDCYVEDPKVYDEDALNSIFGYKLENTQKVSQNIKISNATHEYELVIFIKENDGDQNIDQGKEYRGTIEIEVIDGGINGGQTITGCVGDDC